MIREQNTTPRETSDKRPNYTLRRIVAATALAITGVAIEAKYGIAERILSPTHTSAYDQYNCTTDHADTVTIKDGETIWDQVSTPLANELDIPVDRAQSIIMDEEANPDVSAETRTFVVPHCEK